MKRNLLLLLSVSFLLVLSSCGNKGGKSGLLVPKDAAFVVNINLASLSSKLTWEEIKATSLYKRLAAETQDSLAQQLLDNPDASGLDTKGHIAVFMKTAGRKSYFAWTGKIKDAAAYEKVIVASGKGKTSISKEGPYTVADVSGNAIIIWNSESFIGLSSMPNAMERAMNERGPEREYTPLTADSLKALAMEIFNMKGDALLDSDSRFADLIKQNADLHFWSHAGKFSNNMTFGMTSLMKSSLLIENTVTAGVMNFENGKIVASTKTYYGKEVTDLLKKYEPKAVSNEVINRLPSDNVVAAVVFNYPPEGIKPFLTLIGVDGVANGFLGEVNYSVDEFIKANKGDIAFAINGFAIKADSVAYEGFNGEKEYFVRRKPELEFVAGVSVNDKEAFNKLIGILSQEVKKAEGAIPSVSYKLDNNWFVAGSSENRVNDFLSTNKKPPYAEKISGHMFGGFLNIQELLKITNDQFLSSSDSSGNSQKMFDLSVAFWQDAVSFGDLKNGVATADFEVNLVDKNTNSLKQLNKYFDQLYLLSPRSERIETAATKFTTPFAMLPALAYVSKN